MASIDVTVTPEQDINVTLEGGVTQNGGRVKINNDDSNPDYLEEKLIAGNGINITEGTGASEGTLIVTNTDKGSDVDLSGKQDVLVSGSNIKTINSQTILGSGNIVTPNTTYTASDFDIKDLTDSTNLRDSWDAKWDYDEDTIKAVKVNNAVNADTVNSLTVGTAVPVGAVFTDTTYTAGDGLTLVGTEFQNTDKGSDVDLSDYAKTSELNISNWDSAYSWGDHALVGYLTSETDPIYTSDKSSIVFQNDNISRLTNDVGYLTTITSSDVTTALGYTPYDNSNPDGFISNISGQDLSTADNSTSQFITTSDVLVKSVNSYIGTVVLDTDDISEGTNKYFFKHDNTQHTETYLTTITSSDVNTALGYVPENVANKGQNNGYASLDAGGKIPANELPNTIMEFKGNWNAETNTPTLADGIGNAGDVYLVSVAGTQDLGSGSQTFALADWVLYNGTIWEKSINSNAVVSVNGQQGVVSLNTDNISEGATNKYDKTVTFTGGTNVTIGGTYPDFTITDNSISEEVDTLQTVTARGSVTTSEITAEAFITYGGLSSEFVKGDGSLDANTYLTTTDAGTTYVLYTGATKDLDLGNNDLSLGGNLELTSNAKSIILKSANDKRWMLTISNDGNLVTEEII